MRLGWRAGIVATMLAGYAFINLSAADPGVSFIGMGLVDGSALDRSGLDGQPICRIGSSTDCIDQATLGGFGSGMTYTGHDNVFLAVPDRGPFDGRTSVPYFDRFHFLHMTVDPSKPFPNVTATLLDTRLLKDTGGRSFVGDSSAFSGDKHDDPRFDPEAVRVGRDGTFFVSDEYGPYVLEFNRQGHLVRRLPVPEKFLIDTPSGEVDSAGNSLELYPNLNTSGRQANRGMEGLAITPDGRTLVGLMQNALIQDHGLNSATPPGRVGVTARLLVFDLKTNTTREYVYVLDAVNQGRGVNEIVAVNDHEFLVLERDNRTMVPTPPNEAALPNLKRIYKIDLNKPGLTDVSNVASLPTTAAELGSIVPVTKTLFIDLLDPAYKVNATQTIRDVIAEKMEALAWGPDLPDGRHVLYVVSDNDLYPGLPTQIYAFAVNGSARGITYQPQVVPEPLFPPGQVRKALR